MCTQASGIGSTKQFSIFRALPFFRRSFSVLFWFQHIIFTLHSQSNYFFILNHHYRIGSAVCLYHLAVQCAFRSPIALSLSLCVYVCWRLEFLKMTQITQLSEWRNFFLLLPSGVGRMCGP